MLMPRAYTLMTCIIEAQQPALVFRHQLRLKRRLAVPRNIEIQFAIGRDHRLDLAAAAVARLPDLPCLVSAQPQVVG